jgi:hypothetical protein
VTTGRTFRRGQSPSAAYQATVAWDPATAADQNAVFVCAHGAGGQMNDRSVVAVTSALRRRGIGTLRFFLCAAGIGSARSDAATIACFEASWPASGSAWNLPGCCSEALDGRTRRVDDGGGWNRSDDLLLLAYPSAARSPAKLRVDHLPRIWSVLCVWHARSFCDPALMERTVSGLGANWRVL